MCGGAAVRAGRKDMHEKLSHQLHQGRARQKVDILYDDGGGGGDE